ncbi:MAG: hypothetical protein V9E83_08445 [Baekduia sp.]
MPDTEQVVIGGTIAALVTADAIARSGRPVHLYLPERVGGGFAAIHKDGRTLELGVRALELRFENPVPPPPLSEYRPHIGNHRPWARLIESWVFDLLGERVVEIRRPQMAWRGGVVDDLLFTSDLTVLPSLLTGDERQTMLGQARDARASTGYDAGVLAPELAGRCARMTVTEASIANQGPLYHELFVKPICDKLLARGGDDCAAPLHRKAWATIFHPRTLIEALEGGPIGFRPVRPFHTVKPDGCGAIVTELLARIERSPQVTIERSGDLTGIAAAGDGRTELTFAEQRITAAGAVVAVAPEALFGAAGIPYEVDRATTALAWIETADDEARALPDLIHVLDPENPVMRVSRAGGGSPPGRSLLTVELHHGTPPEQCGVAATTGLISAGLLPDGAEPEVILGAARPTFAIPDLRLLERYADARAAFDALGLDVVLAAGAADVTSDSLNEQIIQGLAIAEANA